MLVRRDLAEQTKKASALGGGEDRPRKQLNNLTPSSWNASTIGATRKALETANRKLDEQSKQAAQLARDKEACNPG